MTNYTTTPFSFFIGDIAMSRKIDETGNHYGKLTVIKRTENNKRGAALWFCKCNCGGNIITTGITLRIGKCQSCGCLRKEQAKLNGAKTKLHKGEAVFNNAYRTLQRGAKRRGIKWILSKPQVRTLITQPCYYCGAKPSFHNTIMNKQLNGMFACNGIDRKNSAKDYTEDNTVSCCWSCNKAKGTLTVSEFQQLIIKIYKHLHIRK